MHKVWLVIKREYITRVRSKMFLWTTIGLPLFSFGIFAVSIFFATRQATRPLRIVVADQVGGIGQTVAQGLKEKLPNGQPMFQVEKVEESPSSQELTALRQQVETGRLDGFLSIPEDVVDKNAAAEFHTRNTGQFQSIGPLNRAVSDAVIARRLRSQGFKGADVGQAVRSVDVEMIKVTKNGEVQERGQTFMTSIAIAMLLYITLIVYGMMTMRSVVEEKSTRIIEILISSVRPTYLLAGKIVGVAGVALTQYLIWAVAGGLLAAYGGAMASAVVPGASMPPIHISAAVFVYAVIFFLAGYLLYASLYAAIGAMVSSEQDAQQVQMPVTMIIVVSFLLFNVILRDPNSTTSVVLSLIPFFSPILMVLRITLQMPPLWQIALSLGMSVVTTALIVQISARIYRVGVLMYGKRPSLVELLRWLRYT
jgi:ABC-2 type transport system permease protein